MAKEKILKNVFLDTVFDIYGIPSFDSLPMEDDIKDKCRCIFLISRLSNDMRELLLRHHDWSDSMFYAIETVISHLRELYYLDDDRPE